MKTITLAAILTISIASVSCAKHDKTNTEAMEETVDVAYPETDSIMLSSTYPGQLFADAKVEVVGRVNGQLLARKFEDGSYVKKGQVLYSIESTKYRDAYQQAQANLSSYVSDLEYAKSHYEAVKKALESNAVSRMEVSQAENAYQQAQANIKSARAALETAQTNLSYCTVTAPISGMTGASTLDVGNYINGEGAPVTLNTIYKTDLLTAVFSIDDQKMIDLVNQSEGGFNSINLKNIPLEFSSDSITHKYYGDLIYVAPDVNSSTGTLQLKCSIPNKYDELRTGMFVKINLPYKALKNAILVKDSAISTDQSGKYLYVVNDSNRVVYTPIVTGPLYQDSLRVVLSGLKPDSRYVTKALLKVRSGMEVKPNVVK